MEKSSSGKTYDWEKIEHARSNLESEKERKRYETDRYIQDNPRFSSSLKCVMITISIFLLYVLISSIPSSPIVHHKQKKNTETTLSTVTDTEFRTLTSTEVAIVTEIEHQTLTYTLTKVATVTEFI